MSNEQKLLHVALEAINALMAGAERDSDNEWGRICMPTNSAMSKGADAAMAIRQTLATTEPEPEPTGMPELPPLPRCMYPNMQHQRMYIGNVYTADQVKAYGEQCWKAAYKHGAWADKPAVNQQLTTEPVDEREAFEKWVTKNGEWPNNALRSCLDPDRYVDIQGLWEAWQARAAMAQVSDINVVESFTNDTKDAKRYRWLADSNNYYEAINLISDGSLTEDALGKAIDAAMAQVVK